MKKFSAKNSVKILFLTLSVILVVALCSCSTGTANPSKILKGYTNESLNITSADVLDTRGYTVLASSENLAVFGNNEGYDVLGYNSTFYDSVYNIKTNTTVFKNPNSEPQITDITVYSPVEDGLNFFVVRTTENAFLYDENGKLLEKSKTNTVSVISRADLVNFNDTFYRVTDKEITKAFDKKGYINYNFLYNELITYSENYYYSYSSSTFTFYDKELNAAATEVLPSYVEEVVYGIVDDGVLFVQYLIELPETAQEYDVLYNGEKYNRVTKTFDVKKRKWSNIDCDYYVLSVVSRNTTLWKDNSFDKVFNDKVQGIMMAYTITDGNIDTTAQNMKFFTIDKQGKIKASVTDMFEDMALCPFAINENYYGYVATNGDFVLLDKKFKTVGRISSYRAFTENYIVTESKLYDFNLNEVVDFQKEDMTYVSSIGNSVFFRDGKDEYHVYNGMFTKLTSPSQNPAVSLTVNENYYYILTQDGYYYYNVKGKHIATSKTELYVVRECKNSILLAEYGDNTIKYYRFS